MSDQPAVIQDAPAPFSGAQDALDPHRPSDFILRSSDGVDFHVHKEILKFVSDFFDNMFSFPQAENGSDDFRRDGKTVLVLPEASDILYRLLFLAYPAHSLDQYTIGMADLDVAIAVLEAAHKYQFLSVERLMALRLESPVLLDAHPHRLFAVARLRKLPELAKKAALCTLKYPVCPAGPTFPEMALLPWEDAHKLFAFHHACATKAQEFAQSCTALYGNFLLMTLHGHLIVGGETGTFVWWNSMSHAAHCGPTSGHRAAGAPLGTIGPAQWFQDHMSRLTACLRILPTGRTVEVEALCIAPAEREIIDTCPACSHCADNDLASFSRQLAARINESNRTLGEVFLPRSLARS
ncbi:hypothetical protein C8R44DRAFT_641325 [Mycena epipterygia]|nr:hypothetical protein C8R44DRAFT_641325 [Mycena epipterygia]